MIEVDGCRLLVDAGLSAKETDRRLGSLGLTAADLHAIFVTHEHHDHVTGIGPLARKHNLPVFMDRDTHGALPRLGRIDHLHLFSAGDRISFQGIDISTFSTTHDAVNPVGFVINSAQGKVGYATDLGMPTRLVTEQLKGCRVLVIEANHDEQMLWDGPYPWPLKQRIRGRHGHLSNLETRQLLEVLCWPGLEALFLAHLSEENNCPDLVAGFFDHALRELGHQAEVIVGRQHQASFCFVGALL